MPRRWRILLLAMLLCAVPALAEGMLSFEAYVARLDAPPEAEWTEETTARVLALEDGTTVSVCLDDGDVAAVTVEALKDGECCAHARAALEATGLLSEASLEQAAQIAEDCSAVLDGVVVYHLIGERRESWAFCAESMLDGMVWQPVHGGEKLHENPICCGIDVARLTTAEAAKALGYEPCKRCAVDSE